MGEPQKTEQPGIWQFRFNRRERTWTVRRVKRDADGVGLGWYWQGGFNSKNAARRWAQGRSAFLREQYSEFVAPPKPDPKPPLTPWQQVVVRIRASDSLISYYRDTCEKLPEAVEACMRSAQLCVEAIATAPEQREHLIRCANSRRAEAERLFQKWTENLNVPAPRLALVKEST